MKVSPSAARTLAWLAIAGQLVFVVTWVVAGALQDGYSHLGSGVSGLGADGAANPWLVNGGLIVLGLAIAAVGVALLPALVNRQAALAAGALFAGAGASFALAGAIPLDCNLSNSSCEDAWRAGELTWQTDAHLWLALAAQVFIVLTPFALAAALWPGPVAPLALGAGVFGLLLGIARFVAESADDDGPYGLIQRLAFGLVHLWVLILAAGILFALRRKPRPGPLVPLRPRDFFAGSWTGHGELVVRPFLFWRLFPQRLEARRTATWISERAWRFDDEAIFGPGRVQRRRTYCEFVSDDLVEVTAGDMPEGAEVVIEEGGFRVVPFRMDFPIGPLNAPVRVHDASRVEPDGTLVNKFEARDLVFGVKIAELTFRVRPVGEPEAGVAEAVSGGSVG
jgi:hypothetical protein